MNGTYTRPVMKQLRNENGEWIPISEDIIKEKVTKVFDYMSEGFDLKTSVKKAEISPSTFYRRVIENPIYGDLLSRAQKIRAEILADEVVDIADNSDDAMKARNQIEARKWVASKFMPQKFGDRIDLNVTSVVDVKSAIEEAKKRAIVKVVEQALPKPKSDDDDDIWG